MKPEDWERKVRDLEFDHIAAGGFVSHEEAERIIEEVYGPSPVTKWSRPPPTWDRVDGATTQRQRHSLRGIGDAGWPFRLAYTVTGQSTVAG